MKKLLAFFFSLWASAAAANVPCTVPFNLQNNTVADATQVMANYNALITCLGNAAAAGVNSDITALFGLSTPLGPTFGGTSNFSGGTSAGTANAQTVTVTPNTFALTTGFRARFNAGFTNTGATTLNANATGAINVFRQTPSGIQALTGGEINSGERTEVEYDGTQYQLITRQAQFGGFGPLTNLASGATADLGTIPSHNINVTGVTTVTAFGSTANTVYPFYRLTFAGVLTLTQNPTSLILPGATSITTAAGDTAFAFYLGSSNWQIVDYAKASGIPVTPTPVSGLLFGCGLSGGGSTTLTIAACTATSDDQANTMIVGSTFTKTFASFAVGTGNGALDTGSVAANTWYHVFEIVRLDTGVVDYLFSLSATAPTFPANYTKKRRLGSIRTDATPNIIAFNQNGDEFLWLSPPFDLSTTNPGTAAVLQTFTVPTGIKVVAQINWQAISTSGTFLPTIYISSPDQTDIAPASFNVWSIGTNNSSIGSLTINTPVSTRTNTSAQIRYRFAASSANTSIQAITMGWLDTRGRNQ